MLSRTRHYFSAAILAMAALLVTPTFHVGVVSAQVHSPVNDRPEVARTAAPSDVQLESGIPDAVTPFLPRLQCLVCIYLNGQHAFLEEEELCADEEHRENNNCRACGGTSECHFDPQEGSCHVGCDLSEEENEELLLGVAAADAERLAMLLQRAPKVILNLERRAIQVEGCGAVRRHISVTSSLLNAVRAELEALGNESQ